MIKLNIGAGESRIEGYIPLDIKTGNDARSLQYADNSVDEIRASHVLEHLRIGEANDAIKEWLRVLKPGGMLYVSVPDIRKMDFNDPQWPFYMFGGQTDEHDLHKSGYELNRLRGLLSGFGFVDIEPWEGDSRDTSGLPISLNLKAKKPTQQQAVMRELTIKWCAVMSVPRLGWNDHWGCATEALRPFNMPIRKHTGAYWHQCIQEAIETCVDDGLDWVVTLDYDTTFTAKHLDRLIGHFAANPNIDALAPLQARRNSKYPLATLKGVNEVNATRDPVQVSTAHFGLTLIRLDALREIPKPWFLPVPNSDGTWSHKGDPERLDADIYFWDKWRKHNKTLYLATDVRVGHLEVMVSEFDDNMNHQVTPVNEWMEREKGYAKQHAGETAEQHIHKVQESFPYSPEWRCR